MTVPTLPEPNKPEPKVRGLDVGRFHVFLGKLRMTHLHAYVFPQGGTTLESIDRAWRAIESSLVLGEAGAPLEELRLHPQPSLDTLIAELDADEFRELYLAVIRHSKVFV